jgi:hypothetical protein
VRRRRIPRWLLWPAAGAVILFAAIQLVPYGWQHSNPPVTRDAPWPTEAARAAARSACYDCHSNETDWPLYSYVAPMSWLVRADVDAGRDEVNFSEWDRDDGEADDAIEEIREGSMPPWRYTVAHPGSSLSAAEEEALIAGLAQLDDDR